MSNKSSNPVILTSFTRHKQESIETYFHEWQSIHQSQQNNSNSQETDDDLQEKDDQGGFSGLLSA